MAFNFGNLPVDKSRIQPSQQGGGFNFGGLQERMAERLMQIEEEKRKQKEESIKKSQADAIRFAEESQSGILNKINKFLGRGIVLPKLVDETPEYTKQRIESQPKSLRENLKNLFTEQTTETASDVFFQQGIDEKNQEAIQANVDAVRTLIERNKNEKDEAVKERRIEMINNLSQQTTQLAERAGGELAKETTLQLLGQSLGTALELTPFLGFKTAGTQLTKLGLKSLTKKGLKEVLETEGRQLAKQLGKETGKDIVTEGALFGGAVGLSEGIQQEDPTLAGVAKSTAVGAAAGGLLGGGIVGLGTVGSKLFSKLATKKITKNAVSEIEKTLGKLDSDEVSVIKEGIEEGISKNELLAAIQESRRVDDFFESPAAKSPEVKTPETQTVKETPKEKPEIKAETPEIKKETPVSKSKAISKSDPRNFDSAEEFVKAQGTPVYHGTQAKFDKFDSKFATDAEGRKLNLGWGKGNFYFTTKKGEALKYATRERSPEVAKLYPKGEPNVIEAVVDIKKPFDIEIGKNAERWRKVRDGYFSDGVSDFNYHKIPKGKTKAEAFVEQLKKEGYDGIIDGQEITAFSENSIKTKSQLTDIWNKAQVKTPKTNQKSAHLAKSIERKMKDAGYIDEDSVIEKATYEGRNIKQQSKKSAKIISEEPERVERIISGEEALPSDISPVYFAGAVEEYGLQTGNRELLEKLAKSNFGGESSRAGSELRMAAEREPDSYVIKMKEIARARKEALEKRIGKKLQSAKKMARKEMERFKPKSNKVTWAGFINEIKCK